ncbi:ATP-binding protein [Leptolyngbya sp. AN03gr2]|uniref:ATP-binding protein n=1 Tax=unclassified Leptolyngbya TaxID=2650499 RepID=UPI003D320263
MTESPFLRNPYVPGKPVSPLLFVGRTNEIETAFDQIFSRGHLAIWGGSGIGKTSFLQMIAAPQTWKFRGHDPAKAVIVLLSCLGVTPFTAANFWNEVFLVLKDALTDEPEIQREVEKYLERLTASKDNLRSILRLLGKKEKFLLLLVDDYDVALQANADYTEEDAANFLSECRNLASHSQESQHFASIVTSLRRLNEAGIKLKPGESPWYNHYLFQPLKPFSETDAAALLGGLPLTPSLREGIRDIAGGSPALLQVAGYLLFREFRANRLPDPDAFAEEFRRATEHYFEDNWTFSNDIEQTLMMLLALTHLKGRLLKKRYDLGDTDVIFSQKERELRDLEERGVVVCQLREGKKHYRFASSLMEWWVIKEIENSDEESLQSRQRTFLNLMSRRQAETVTDAIRWLWQHKEEVPTILVWLGKLTSALSTGFV